MEHIMKNFKEFSEEINEGNKANIIRLLKGALGNVKKANKIFGAGGIYVTKDEIDLTDLIQEAIDSVNYYKDEDFE